MSFLKIITCIFFWKVLKKLTAKYNKQVSKWISKWEGQKLQITASLLRIMTILITNFCKVMTNSEKKLLQITAILLQITTVGYYKLQQFYYKLRRKIITNYGSSYFWKIWNSYKLRQILLQITIAFSVITNYGKYHFKLRHVLKNTTLWQITS